MLDRNPVNHLAEVEQSAFAPSNLVPGIGLSPDKMLMGRIFSYHDTHGHMTYRHAGSQPVYAPNGYGGPQADLATALPTWMVEAAEIGHYAHARHIEDDDFTQPGTLVRDVMDDTDREHLAGNIVGHASNDVSDEVQRRVVAYWTSVDATLGASVATGLGASVTV